MGPRREDSLALFAMIKNERDIIADFIDQAVTLFDSVYILDHESRDGTWEFCEKVAHSSQNVHLFKLSAAGYPQSEVTTWFCHWIFGIEQPAWLFFLDADEFLPFNDPTALREALNPYSSFDCLQIAWRNVMPLDLTSWQGLSATPLVQVSQPSRHMKVAVRRTAVERAGKGLTVLQGNHAIIAPENGHVSTTVASFPLLHIPFRSVEQVQQKLILGELAYSGRAGHRGAQGEHWASMLEGCLGAGDRWFQSLRAQVLNYGLRASEWTEESDRSFAPLVYQFAYLPSCDRSAAPERSHLTPSLLVWLEVQRLLRSTMAAGNTSPDNASPEFTHRSGAYVVSDIEGYIVARHGGDRATAVATEQKPPHGNSEEMSEGPEVVLLRQIMFWMNLSPTSFPLGRGAAHLGFMSALIALVRPRTIVQLGVASGGSFFALCDACNAHGIDAEVIGVDSWLPNPRDGGTEPDTLFAELTTRVGRDYPFARLVRTDLGVARRRIPEGVVDLLCLDGCRSIDDTETAFMAWFSTLSDRGVCVLQELSLKNQGVGASALWERLRSEWPSIEFHHSGGLGVLFVGHRQPPEVELLLEAWQGSPEVRALIRSAAELLASTFPARLGALENEHTIDSLKGEIARLSQSLSTSTEARDHLHRQSEQLRVEYERSLSTITEARDQLYRQLKQLRLEYEQSLSIITEARDQLHRRLEQLRLECERLALKGQQLAGTVRAMRESTSWRITAPIRSVSTSVRAFKRSRS